MIRSLVERLIRRLKGDSRYTLQTAYSTRELLIVLWWRGLQVLRGLRLLVTLGHAEWPLFCGRRVRVEHGYHVSTGPSLILDDGVFISGLSEKGVVLGRNVTVGQGTVIVGTGVVARRGVGVVIGNRSGVGAHSYVGGQGGVRIGDDVIMGPGVRIFSENHVYSDRDMTIRLQGETRREVVIEDDCWIGAGATILSGVVVGRGAVVAAGAVVNRSVEPFTVVGGVPAKPIAGRGGA